MSRAPVALVPALAALALLHRAGVGTVALCALALAAALAVAPVLLRSPTAAVARAITAAGWMAVHAIAVLSALADPTVAALAGAGVAVVGLAGWGMIATDALRVASTPAPPGDGVEVLASKLAAGRQVGAWGRLRVAGLAAVSVAVLASLAAVSALLSAPLFGPAALAAAGLLLCAAAVAARAAVTTWARRVPSLGGPRWPRRLALLAIGVGGLGVAMVPLSISTDVPGLVSAGLVALIAALAVATAASRSATPSGPGVALAREGVVEFHPEATALFRWDEMVDVVPLGAGASASVGIRLTVCALPRDLTVHAEPARGRLWARMREAELRRHRAARGVDLVLDPATVPHGDEELLDVIERFASNPLARRTLPTFDWPDGPPSAVLADLDAPS